MKNLIFITLLILTFITGDTYTQSYFGKSVFKDRIQANNVLYVTTLAQGTNEHATIASALSAYQTGMLIILAPEYFDEDVTISIDNVHIQGLSKERSKIKSLTVTGGSPNINNLTVVNDAVFKSAKTVNYFDTKIVLNDIDFFGDLSLGTSTQRMDESYLIKDCTMYGDNKFIVNTLYGLHSDRIILNMRMLPIATEGVIGNRSDIWIYEGNLRFENSGTMYVDSLKFITTDKYALVGFYHCYPLFIDVIYTSTSTQYHILVIQHCVLTLGTTSDFIFNGLFELDVIQSSVSIKTNIIFNSTANSRFDGFQQRGYNSPTTITGTGLAYLRIYHSTFRCTAPVGVADDRNNVWSAFIDD